MLGRLLQHLVRFNTGLRETEGMLFKLFYWGMSPSSG